jgi:hypothetical protein
VKVVPNSEIEGTGAPSYFDAKFHPIIKYYIFSNYLLANLTWVRKELYSMLVYPVL